MVASVSATLDAAFHALAHPTRRAMLRMLAEGERTVGELAEPFDCSLAASSKHLKVLEKARLVRRRVDGRTHTVQLVAQPLEKVVDWTEECRATFEASFARLDALLEEMKGASGRRKTKRAKR